MKKNENDYSELKGVVGIYKITRKSTGQMYIGQSVRDIQERWKNHIKTPIETSYIDNSMKKYGADEFELELIEDIGYIKNKKLLKEKANELEIYYIDKYNTYKDNFHYNLTPGGEGWGSGEDHPNFKNYPRILIDNSQSERPYYYIYFFNKRVLYSYDKSALQKYIDDGTWIKFYEGEDTEFIKKEKEKLKYTGEDHWNYTEEPRIVKSGIHQPSGKQKYALSWGKNNIIYSLNLKRLLDLLESEEYLNYEGYEREFKLDLDKIEEMYLKGYSSKEIAQELDCSSSTIINRLNKLFSSEEIKRIRYQKASEKNKKRFSDPKEREKISLGLKKRFSDPKEREKLRKIQKERYQNFDERLKASKLNTSTGFYSVCKVKQKNLIRYEYYYYENDKRRSLKSARILELEKRVKEKGLPWEIVDEEKARKTLKINENEITDPPRKSKYILWDDTKLFYRKSLFKKSKGLKPIGVFSLKYNNKLIPCGVFNEFISPSIIHDLINEFTEHK